MMNEDDDDDKDDDDDGDDDFDDDDHDKNRDLIKQISHVLHICGALGSQARSHGQAGSELKILPNSFKSV